MKNIIKIHKPRNIRKERSKKSNYLKGSIIGLKSKSYAKITNNQIEAVRKDLVKLTKRNCKMLIRLHINIPTTKKSVGSRMGKGIGIFNNYINYLKKGTIILELFYNTLISKVFLIKILGLISKKFSFVVSILDRKIKGIK
jgi:large subunit ribosomal protein L16